MSISFSSFSCSGCRGLSLFHDCGREPKEKPLNLAVDKREKTDISQTMRDAINFALLNNGKLYRHPGGFWTGREYQQHGKRFCTTTIRGLVCRGLAKYTNERKGRYAAFPVEITLTCDF